MAGAIGVEKNNLNPFCRVDYTNSNSRYIPIGTINYSSDSSVEGITSGLTVIVTGGGAFSDSDSVRVVNIRCHRGSIHKSVDFLAGDAGDGASMGYVVSGSICTLYLKTGSYNSRVYVTLLALGRHANNAVIRSGGETTTQPSGYIEM